MLFDDTNIINVYLKSNEKWENDSSDILIGDKDGLIKGNMFKDEYVPYLNYEPHNLNPKTEKEALMLKLYETDFALHDISLFLDLHPKDIYIYEVFKRYVAEYKKYQEIFEKKYGPIDLECTIYNNYEWSKNPWPWDKDGGTMYV